MDTIRRQPTRRRTGGKDELARRVQTKGTRDRFGRHVPQGRQLPGGGVDGEPRQAVVAAVAHIQELPRRRKVNLGAGVPGGEPLGQGGERLDSGEGARRRVQTIGRDTAPLLVRKIDDWEGGMKAIVAGAQARRGLDPERRVGAQTAGLSVELQLPNRIGARALPQGFQDIIVEAGDVGHEGKLVGGVGLDGVGAHGRGQRVAGWGAHGAVRAVGMDRRIAALIIRSE